MRLIVFCIVAILAAPAAIADGVDVKFDENSKETLCYILTFIVSYFCRILWQLETAEDGTKASENMTWGEVLEVLRRKKVKKVG